MYVSYISTKLGGKKKDNGKGLVAWAYDQLSSSQLDISLILDQQCIFIDLRTNRKTDFKKKEKEAVLCLFSICSPPTSLFLELFLIC